MSRGRGLTLAERSGPAESATAGDREVRQDRPRPVVNRHCWVSGLQDFPGRRAGLVLEWKADVAQRRWDALVAYAVDDAGRTILIQAWLPACCLEPAV